MTAVFLNLTYICIYLPVHLFKVHKTEKKKKKVLKKKALFEMKKDESKIHRLRDQGSK